MPFYHSDFEFSFGGAFVYRRARLRLLTTELVHYGQQEGEEQTTNMPRCFLVATFLDLRFKMKLRAVNVHLPISEKDKWLALDVLTEHLESSSTPIIAMGSWNFFDDLDGKHMRKKMIDFFGNDAAHPLFSREESGNFEISGTFIGFSHDPYRADMTERFRRESLQQDVSTGPHIHAGICLTSYRRGPETDRHSDHRQRDVIPPTTVSFCAACSQSAK